MYKVIDSSFLILVDFVHYCSKKLVLQWGMYHFDVRCRLIDKWFPLTNKANPPVESLYLLLRLNGD